MSIRTWSEDNCRNCGSSSGASMKTSLSEVFIEAPRLRPDLRLRLSHALCKKACVTVTQDIPQCGRDVHAVEYQANAGTTTSSGTSSPTESVRLMLGRTTSVLPNDTGA